MKVEELFDKIEPLLKELEQDKDTALFMMGTDSVKECGCVQGKFKAMVTMLVDQMVKQEDIARVLMASVEAFIAYMESNEKDSKQKLS